jgi:hypothetical protein
MRIRHEVKFEFKEDWNFVVEKIKLKWWNRSHGNWTVDAGSTSLSTEPMELMQIFSVKLMEIKGALKWLLDADIYGLDNELSKNKICTWYLRVWKIYTYKNLEQNMYII